MSTIRVFSDDILLEFCCQDCWQHRKPHVIDAFSLLTTYPRFAMVMSCSTCEKAIDCTQPHVTLNVYEIDEHVAPWLTTGQMLDDRLFAVQCSECDPPGEAEVASEADEEQNGHKASADAAQ